MRLRRHHRHDEQPRHALPPARKPHPPRHHRRGAAHTAQGQSAQRRDHHDLVTVPACTAARTATARSASTTAWRATEREPASLRHHPPGQPGWPAHTHEGDYTQTGNQTITGMVTVSNDVIAAGISLVKHPHGQVTPGNGQSGAPVQ